MVKPKRSKNENTIFGRVFSVFQKRPNRNRARHKRTIDTEFRFYEKEGGRALRGENFELFQTIVKECQNKKIFPADFITHSYYDKKHEFFDLVVSDKSWEFDFAQEFFLNMIKESRQNNFLFIETFLKSGRIDLLSFDKTMTEDALFVAARFGRRDVIELFLKPTPISTIFLTITLVRHRLFWRRAKFARGTQQVFCSTKWTELTITQFCGA